MELIDTHAHLMFKQFRGEVPGVIERAHEVGVEKIINVGCDIKSCRDSVDMADEYDQLYATLGMHPYETMDVDDGLMEEWVELIEKDKVGAQKIVAIGECGLDYFKAQVPKDVQKRAFRMQLELANKVGLPVIVHNRDADEDCLEILKEYDGLDGRPRVDVVFHCYASGLNFARELWSSGYMTSFTGVITYPNAIELKEVVREVPDDLFMIETDCPFLAPQTHRGQRNEPAYVVEVAKEIARLKGISVEEVAKLSTENGRKFYKI